MRQLDSGSIVMQGNEEGCTGLHVKVVSEESGIRDVCVIGEGR